MVEAEPVERDCHGWRRALPGLLESEDETQAARVAAENVPGVRKVEDHRMLLAELPSML